MVAYFIAVTISIGLMGFALAVQIALYFIGSQFLYPTDAASLWHKVTFFLVAYTFLLSLPIYFVIDLFSPRKSSTQRSKGSNERQAAVAFFITIVLVDQFIYATFYTLQNCISDASFGNSIYFSFLTYSTLGYGDENLADVCKPIAVSQSVFGLLSVGAIIALLNAFSKNRDQ